MQLQATSEWEKGIYMDMWMIYFMVLVALVAV